METIVSVWGNLFALKDDIKSLKEMEIAYLLIQIRNVKKIDEVVDMDVESKLYNVRAREVVFDFHDI